MSDEIKILDVVALTVDDMLSVVRMGLSHER